MTNNQDTNNKQNSIINTQNSKISAKGAVSAFGMGFASGEKIPIILFFLLLGFFGLAKSSQAATHYVSASGNAIWANSTNISTPTSPQMAMVNAVAGDVIYFRGGTYNLSQVTGGSGTWGQLMPSNSGTNGKPIIFIAYTGETPILNAADDGGGEGTAFSTCGKNYIILDGFTIQGDGGTIAGRVLMHPCNNTNTNNIFRNLIINGGSTINHDGDNREGIRVDSSTDCSIINNKVYNFKSDYAGCWHNSSGYKGYNNIGLSVENNEFYNNCTGVYFKREHINSTIKYNYIHDNDDSEIFSDAYNAFTNSGNNIYHNVIVHKAGDGTSAVAILCSETATNDNFTFYNNSLWGTSGAKGLSIMCGNNFQSYNNIISGFANTGGDTGGNIFFGYANSYSISKSNYNQFGTGFYIRTHLYGSAVTYASITDWQASNDITPSAHPDLNSLSSNPLFTNGSGNYSSLSDFNLQATSPCKGTGQGGADMGANISLVGIQGGGGGGDVTPPAAPSGLAVN